MLLDFNERQIELVLVPQDLRGGYASLCAIAQRYLNINLRDNKHYVVFISKSKSIAKIIGHDPKGTVMVVRHLEQGKYQQLLSDIDSGSVKSLSKEQLFKYLDGENLQIKPTKLL